MSDCSKPNSGFVRLAEHQDAGRASTNQRVVPPREPRQPEPGLAVWSRWAKGVRLPQGRSSRGRSERSHKARTKSAPCDAVAVPVPMGAPPSHCLGAGVLSPAPLSAGKGRTDSNPPPLCTTGRSLSSRFRQGNFSLRTKGLSGSPRPCAELSAVALTSSKGRNFPDQTSQGLTLFFRMRNSTGRALGVASTERSSYSFRTRLVFSKASRKPRGLSEGGSRASRLAFRTQFSFREKLFGRDGALSRNSFRQKFGRVSIRALNECCPFF